MDSVAFSDKKLMRRSMPAAALMLKDYLLDDMSSCSSNGFRSIPRRQCCNNVKFILEFDLKNPNDFNGKPKPKSSAFRRASAAVINAVKIFPRRRSILPRSLSRKLSNRSFWKKASEKDISFLKSFKCLNSNSLSVSQPSTAVSAVSAATAATRKGKSLSDSSSVFTSDNLLSSSSNSESSCENDTVLNERSPEKAVSKIAAVTVGASSTVTSKGEWDNILEEKEQSSPVSVLDFPFDNQDDISWPFRRNVSTHEGLKQKLPEKFKIFKTLSKLDPVDLSKRFATIELNDVSTQSDNNDKIFEGCDEVEKAFGAEDLLELVKEACPYYSQLGYKIDGLLVDFFNERLVNNVGDFSKMFDVDEEIKVAENWINGQQEELFLGWEMEKNRKVYIKYIENGGKFDEEREEIANEIEDEIFSCLLDELLVG